MDGNIEHELCNNCKKEIPQTNYVMHTMHCARNITLCQNCKEPVPKSQFEEHKKSCVIRYVPKKPLPPPTNIEKSSYFQSRKAVEDKKVEARKERYLQKMDRLVDSGYSLNDYGTQLSNSRLSRPSTSSEPSSSRPNGLVTTATKLESAKSENVPQSSAAVNTKKDEAKSSGMLACKFCDLELPKLDLEDHENYCGSRTDKCLECGELVMFKDKQSHMDSNHAYLKSRGRRGENARPTWDSSSERASSSADTPTRRRPPPLSSFGNFDYDPMPYLPSAYQPGSSSASKKKEGESYKEISRRLDWPAPQPPPSRRRNPPTELVIPCEFCGVPVPHEDLIQHETGCRPDLARYRPRRHSPDEEDEYFTAPAPSSPEVELPCEFCGDMVPASQLLGHQVRCT